MWSAFVRFVFFGLLLALSFVRLRKTEMVSKKRVCILILVLFFICLPASTLVPIENIFTTFPSAESAFHYKHLGEIGLVVDGDTSTMILSFDESSTSDTIIPKSGEGWKLDTIFDMQQLAHKSIGSIIISVDRQGNAGDYYITILNPEESKVGLLSISDSENSQFYRFF